MVLWLRPWEALCFPASEYIRTSWCIRARAWDFKPMGASVNHLKFLELDDMGEDLQFHFSSNMLICSNTVSDKTNMLERGWTGAQKPTCFSNSHIYNFCLNCARFTWWRDWKDTQDLISLVLKHFNDFYTALHFVCFLRARIAIHFDHITSVLLWTYEYTYVACRRIALERQSSLFLSSTNRV